MSDTTRRPIPYAIAALAVTLAFGATQLPYVGPSLVGMLFFSLLFSAWYGGHRPGYFATSLLIATILVLAVLRWGIDIPLTEYLGMLQFVSLGILVTSIITSLQVAGRQAEASRLRLSAVLTSIGDAVIAADAEGRITFLNPVAESLTGWTQEEACGRPLGEVFVAHEEATDLPIDDPVPRVIDSDTARSLVDHTILVSRDGGRRPIAETVAPIREADGSPVGIVLVFRDIGDRRRGELERERLNRELREADRRKDEFLAMLGHELRNPLAAVANAVAVARTPEGRKEVDWSLDVAGRQVRHLSRLVDDLLDVARLTSGKIDLRREVIDAVAVLAQAAEVVDPLVRERGHRLEMETDDAPLWVHADPTRLEQVVVNLLSNAAKYSLDGGEIRLTAGREDDRITIRVADRGIGIPPERLPEMFVLFAQGERDADRAEGGLGIGLTVVQKLVELHGGTIEAFSEGLGTGCEFVVRLPAAAEPAAAETQPEEGTIISPAESARILVVDDSADTLRGMERLLKLSGHDVMTADSGLAALEAARDHRPHFVLLDIGLPGMDGYQVAENLRREDFGREAVIIAVSGYGRGEDRARSMAAGIDHHLIKPVDHDALFSILARGGRSNTAACSGV